MVDRWKLLRKQEGTQKEKGPVPDQPGTSAGRVRQALQALNCVPGKDRSKVLNSHTCDHLETGSVQIKSS